MEWNRDRESKRLSVAEAKSRFSEYVSKVAYAGQRYVITKRGRPMVALVSIEDLENIQVKADTEKISEIAGRWEDFDEIEEDIIKAHNSRKEDRGRDVSF